MNIKKLLITLLFLSIPVLADPIIITQPRPIDHSSRYWLYWMASYSPGFILTNEIKSNLPYYVRMIENHIKRLERKIENENTQQNALLKRSAAMGALSMISGGISYYSNRTLMDREYGDYELGYIAIALASTPTFFISSFVSARNLYKGFYYKQNLQRKLRRDKWILELLTQQD